MKTYVEVACTIYKNILVEVEHDEGEDMDEILRVAVQEAESDTGADDTELVAYFDSKPEGTNMAVYDDFLETYV